MQCANCGFHNMPGSEACARCSTLMRLGAVAVDVQPPRAGRFTKKLRRALPIDRLGYRARDAMDRVRTPAIVSRSADTFLPAAPILLRLVFPGWGHFHLHQRLRGHLFLWSYLLCLLIMYLNFGSTWGGVWLGMAFSVHSSAALDIVTQTFADAGVRDRIVRSIVLSVLLWFLVYWPVGYLIGLVAQPHTIQITMEPFRSEDVVLVNQLSSPRRGAVVLYQLSDYRIVLNAGQHGRQQIFEGQTIDRILAGPGDVVRCDAGRLTVNGSPPVFTPLNGIHLAATFRVVVPDDSYFIVPSGAPGIAGVMDQAAWQSIGCVPGTSIAGRAYLRIHPLSRWHFIR